MSNTFTWVPIGQPNWQGQQTAVAQIPNCGYGDDCYVVCEPSPSGWAIVAPLPKAYVDKLHAGKVQLHVQYKNPNYLKKFLKSSVSEQHARLIAEQLACRLIRETV